MTQMGTDKNTSEKRDLQTYAIIGAAMAVHSELGPGFLERVYQEALAIEFRLRDIPYECEVQLPISYKGERLDTKYRADFVCYGSVIVELKALSNWSDSNMDQLIHYLKATEFNRGLLFNFGAERLQSKRV